MLDPKEISKLEDDAVMCKLEVFLPKFKVDIKLDLNRILEAGRIQKIDNENVFNMFDPAISGAIRFRQATCL